MGQIADLNVTQYDMDLINLGSDLDRILALAIDAKTKYNAHAHTGTGVAPTNSISSADGIGVTDVPTRERMQTSLTGLNGRFTNAYVDAVTFINEAKSKFNAHTHAAIGGAGSNSISATFPVPASITGYEEEQWNIAYEPFYNAKVGTKMKDVIVLCHELLADYNAHTHPQSMTQVASLQITASNPTTLTA